MDNITGITGTSTADFLKQKNNIKPSDSDGFASHLKSALNDINELQVKSEDAVADLATGQVKDLHQAALAIGKAEINVKLMLEIRN